MVFFKHEIRMARKALLIWSSIVGGMILVMMLMFPSMKEEMGKIAQSYANLGPFAEAFGLTKLQMGTAMGFYGIEAGAMLSLGGAMFAAITATAMLSKEEGGHTTEFIYVTPKSRTYFLTQKLLAVATTILLFDLICFLISIISFVIIGEDIQWNKFLLYFLAQTLMHLQIASICYGISAFLRKVNVGLGIGIAMLLYFTNMIANITEGMQNLRYLTPYYYSDAATIFDTTQIPTAHLCLGILIAALGITSAYLKYTKKDLNI